MHNEWRDLINANVPDAHAEVINPPEEKGTPSVKVQYQKIAEVCEFLKSNPSTDFQTLQVISGVDFKERFELNYMLLSMEKNQDLMIKTHVPRPAGSEEIAVPTIAHIYKAANFQERETYDMLGIIFEGHPDHRRILCPDDWEGYPLRKDYVVQEMYHDMKVNPEEKVNNADHFFFKEMIEKYDEKQVSYSWPTEDNVGQEEATE